MDIIPVAEQHPSKARVSSQGKKAKERRSNRFTALVLPERNSYPFQLGLFPYYCVEKASPGSPGSTFPPCPTKKFLR
jgi:hypothetical protein